MWLSRTFQESAYITCFFACLMRAAAYVVLSFLESIWTCIYFFHKLKIIPCFLKNICWILLADSLPLLAILVQDISTL